MTAGIFSNPSPRVYSIDAGRPFLADLADTLRREIADSMRLAEMLIYVPTRRAARVLGEAFASERASLLPRIRALGDVDEDELLLDAGADERDIAPAVSDVERRLILARFIAEDERRFPGQESWPAALAAAEEVAALLDSLYTEEIDLEKLRGLAPADHAEHWERSLEFLKIVTEKWPAHLTANGLEDPARRRARLIDAEGARIARVARETPVIIAGTTGSVPAVARLMKIVAHAPLGAVVLPGLDRTLLADERGWALMDDGHPQAGVKAALAAIEIEPNLVRAWPGSGRASPRARMVSLALRPAAATDDWLALVGAASGGDPGFGEALDGVSFVEAATEEAEAAAVALLLREALETPDRTAMLVTPDRDLGRRVAAKMARWSVAVEDSAGAPLASTRVGAYLHLVAEWLTGPADPRALMALARCPLARFGEDHSAMVNVLDRRLRGPQLTDDFARLAARLGAADERLAPLFARLGEALFAWPNGATIGVEALLDAHLAAAETLCAGAGEGARRLWSGAEGERAARLLADIRGVAPSLGAISPRDYPQAFVQLISGAAIRSAAETHPRLAILGPLEARLQSADLIILGGLNEGVWPADPRIDAFLSRQMRADVGLPTLERRIGLSAHDFAQLACAPNVVFTRANVSGGTPSRPSRWIVRLKNILKGAGVERAGDATARLAALAVAADRPDIVKATPPPRPTPPQEARPRQLSVTQVEGLMRDPFSIYAGHVLGLKPLDPLAEPVDRRRFGLVLHALFEKFVTAKIDPDDPRARSALEAILSEEAETGGLRPSLIAAWRPRLDETLEWFLNFERDLKRRDALSFAEVKGEATFHVENRPFTLTARTDRIVVEKGEATVFDYKSGTIPTLEQIHVGFSAQLPLTALILQRGGFPAVGATSVDGFFYVKVFCRKEEGKDESGEAGDEARETLRDAEAAFAELIAAFDDPATPYLSQPRPQFLNKYGKFDVLARRREWGVEGEVEE